MIRRNLVENLDQLIQRPANFLDNETSCVPSQLVSTLTINRTLVLQWLKYYSRY